MNWYKALFKDNLSPLQNYGAVASPSANSYLTTTIGIKVSPFHKGIVQNIFPSHPPPQKAGTHISSKYYRTFQIGVGDINDNQM